MGGTLENHPEFASFLFQVFFHPHSNVIFIKLQLLMIKKNIYNHVFCSKKFGFF